MVSKYIEFGWEYKIKSRMKAFLDFLGIRELRREDVFGISKYDGSIWKYHDGEVHVYDHKTPQKESEE